MSISKSSSLWQYPVQLDIKAEDGASELILVNSAYDVVSKAIGNLSLEVSPGEYHVRQRIGDSESVERIEVGESDSPHTVLLKSLDFASPAPILGTSSFPEGSLDDWRKPTDLVGKPGIRLAIRGPSISASAPPTKALLAHMSLEKARLRLETLQGKLVAACDDSNGSASFGESALFLFDVETPPGHYVLVQSNDDATQQCLPLIVHPDWSPRVYLLCLQDQENKDADVFIPVDLDNASIIYWPTSSGSSPGQSDLIRVEAARKALARGRSTGGYMRGETEDAPASPVRDPMLALIDAYLVLKDITDGEISQACAVIQLAADALGEDFPDVIALRHAFASSRVVKQSPQTHVMDEPPAPPLPGGPPILAYSWRHLLAAGETSARLSELMPSAFVPDPSSTWFIWTEPRGVRHEEAKPDGAPPQQRTDFITSALRAAQTKASDDGLSAASKALVAVLQNDAVKGWVDNLVQRTAERNSQPGRVLDPRLLKLVDGLASIQNPLLVQAFGAQELARRLLLSFNLPSDRLKDLPALLRTTLEESGLRRGFVTRQLTALKQYTVDKVGEELAALVNLLIKK